ncbi:hypothetical protein GBAR_LOCUS7230 [Geodia barretti]|uniref:Uncharacterized protein n=1 Tax=Geodia barretti TaxID=519541 RepID=A0AA35RIV7_GEOBA|nr:hypothetical protein GBAR_LOCUS7230 [Geodia barretti]
MDEIVSVNGLVSSGFPAVL